MTEGFDVLDAEGTDEILALVYHEAGADGLEQLLDMTGELLCRQDLEEAAEGLQAAGLLQAAEIVMQAAAEATTASRWTSRKQRLAKNEACRRYWGQ